MDINHFLQYDVREFYILGGHKVNLLRSYFQDSMLSNHVIFDFENKTSESIGTNSKCKIHVINTGEFASTQSRLFQIKEKLKDYEYFFLTYGDGLSNVSIDKLISFHKSHGKLATVTAVRPPARFGTIEISNGLVTKFAEKDPQDAGWINGGFFCLNKKVCTYISDSTISFESEPLNALVASQELTAFEHHGWWHPMDTLRDKRTLEELWNKGKAPWVSA